MAEVTTYYSSSAGKHLVIADLPYPQLVNTINALSRRLGGGTDETLDALRAELARRPAPQPGDEPANAARHGSGSPQAKAAASQPAPDPRAGLAKIGDNNPPPEPTVADRLRERLEAAHAKLIEDIANHELTASKLPKTVENDDDVAKINAWVVRARELYRQAEGHRKTEKDDYLQAGKAIDSFFAEIKDDVADRAKTLEARNTPYLQAKAAREEAERRALAESKRKAAEEAAEAERVANEAAAAARREAEEAEKKIKDAATEEARLAAEEEARQANRRVQTESKAAEQAGKDVRQAVKSAERDEKIADGGHRHRLGKVAAGGGSASLKTVWKHRITDLEAVKNSLGPLAPFIGSDVIRSCLMRAAKADPRPEVPGAEFYPETETQTR